MITSEEAQDWRRCWEELKDCFGYSEEEAQALSLSRDKLVLDWYASGETQAGYTGHLYLFEGFYCFRRYTRGAISLLASELRNSGIHTILDFGAGPGFTSRLLAAKFNAKVYYLDFPGGDEWRMAQWLKHTESRMELVLDIRQISGGVDLICAFEVFEHIKEPIKLLRDLAALRP